MLMLSIIVLLMMMLILRMIRDAEEKLMADVEGWEVGTFYGHKVYKVSSEITVIGVNLRNNK